MRVIEQFAAETADRLWADHLDNGQIEWMSAVANRPPTMVVAKLLGLPEGVRFEPPFRGHYRHVLRNTTLAGVEAPADSHLLLMWGAANRDPAHFEAPT